MVEVRVVEKNDEDLSMLVRIPGYKEVYKVQAETRADYQESYRRIFAATLVGHALFVTSLQHHKKEGESAGPRICNIDFGNMNDDTNRLYLDQIAASVQMLTDEDSQILSQVDDAIAHFRKPRTLSR